MWRFRKRYLLRSLRHSGWLRQSRNQTELLRAGTKISPRPPCEQPSMRGTFATVDGRDHRSLPCAKQRRKPRQLRPKAGSFPDAYGSRGKYRAMLSSGHQLPPRWKCNRRDFLVSQVCEPCAGGCQVSRVPGSQPSDAESLPSRRSGTLSASYRT